MTPAAHNETAMAYPSGVPPERGNGRNSSAPPDATPTDPLAGMTPWQMFQRCIWVSDEDAHTKITLLCISRYMDKNLRSSSMSYAQIAQDCGFSESTGKRCAKKVAGAWLQIGVGKGRYVPGKGNENLYHGIIPKSWNEAVRRLLLKGRDVEPDEDILRAADEAQASRNGVSEGHPEQSGVSDRHPENRISGCHTDTGVSGRHNRGVTVTPSLPDYLNKKDSIAASNEAAGTRDEKNPKRKRVQRSQVDPNWRPTDEQTAWAKARWQTTDTQIATELDKFRAYHKAKGSLMDDWGAAWQTWWLNGYHKIPLRPQGNAGATIPDVAPYWWRDTPQMLGWFGPVIWDALISKFGVDGQWPVEWLGPAPPGDLSCIIPDNVIPKLNPTLAVKSRPLRGR